jgi:hypothetical protein
MDERKKIDWAQQDKKLRQLLEKKQTLPTNHPLAWPSWTKKSWPLKNSSAPTESSVPTNAFSHNVAISSTPEQVISAVCLKFPKQLTASPEF